MQRKYVRKAAMLMKSVLLAYVITAVMLLTTALLMYKAGIPAAVISILLVGTYILSGFFGGLYAGKQVEHHKYLWGCAIGATYFAIYLIASIAFGGDAEKEAGDFIRTALLIIACSTFGGMLS